MSMDIMLKKVCTERTNTYLDLKGLKYPKWLEKYIQDIKEPYLDFKAYFEAKNLNPKDWTRGGTILNGQKTMTCFKNKITNKSMSVYLKDVPQKTRTIKGVYYTEIEFINGWINNEEKFIWTKEKLAEIKETYCGCDNIFSFVDKFVDGENFVMIF